MAAPGRGLMNATGVAADDDGDSSTASAGALRSDSDAGPPPPPDGEGEPPSDTYISTVSARMAAARPGRGRAWVDERVAGSPQTHGTGEILGIVNNNGAIAADSRQTLSERAGQLLQRECDSAFPPPGGSNAHNQTSCQLKT
jgi:hypothetical protein